MENQYSMDGMKCTDHFSWLETHVTKRCQSKVPEMKGPYSLHFLNATLKTDGDRYIKLSSELSVED